MTQKSTKFNGYYIRHYAGQEAENNLRLTIDVIISNRTTFSMVMQFVEQQACSDPYEESDLIEQIARLVMLDAKKRKSFLSNNRTQGDRYMRLYRIANGVRQVLESSMSNHLENWMSDYEENL